MQYNRMLHISTAGSRKATQWPESAILWSEFLEKLKPLSAARRAWRNTWLIPRQGRMN